MTDGPDTIPSPPPSSWLPEAVRGRVASAVVVALLGTGGCGAVLTGASQVVSAIRTSDAATTKRLDRIEGKLDRSLERLATAEAAANAARAEAVRLDSNVDGLRAELASYRTEIRRAGR